MQATLSRLGLPLRSASRTDTIESNNCDRIFFGWEEFVLAMLMIALTYFMVGAVIRSDEHIRVSWFAERVFGEKRAQWMWFALEGVIGLLICGYLCYLAADKVLLDYRGGMIEHYAGFPIGWNPPRWAVRLIIPVGMGMAALFYLERCIKLVLWSVGRRPELWMGGSAFGGPLEEEAAPREGDEAESKGT